MAYTTGKKMKGVGYFNHFPKNFLKPYGRSEPYPADSVALARLRPEGCEWLRCPHVATSELASTISDNMPLLHEEDILVNKEKMGTFMANLRPLSHMLQVFHRDSSREPTDGERRALLLEILNPSPQLSVQLSKCVEVGAALFSIGIHLKVVQTLISNPSRYAEMMSFSPNPDPPFTSSKNLLDLLPLLSSYKSTVPPPSSSINSLISLLQGQSSTHPTNLLQTPSQPLSQSPANQLLATSTAALSSLLATTPSTAQPQTTTSTSRKGKKKRKRRLLEDDDEPEKTCPMPTPSPSKNKRTKKIKD